MNFPVAPPAFDATTGPGRPRRADRGADIGAGCGLVFLELIALAVIFGLWFLSGFNLDPAKTATTDSLWNYLAAAGGVGVLAIVAATIAARAGAAVTVATQAVMAALICVIVVGGAAGQSHQDRLCRDIPSAAGCKGDNQTAARAPVEPSSPSGTLSSFRCPVGAPGMDLLHADRAPRPAAVVAFAALHRATLTPLLEHGFRWGRFDG